MPNVLTIPNSGVISFNNTAYSDLTVPPLSSSARITYDQGGGLNVSSYATATTALNRFTVDGTQGRLFSVTDVLTGTLFSVNNITGLPILEVRDNNTIIGGRFNTNTFVVSGVQVFLGALPFNTTAKFGVSGSVTVLGTLSAGLGNSEQWNSTFTSVNSNSANWGNVYTSVNSNSAANWQNSKTIVTFNATQNQPPSGSFATLDTRNSIAVLNFDDAAVESAIFLGAIPENYVLTSGLAVYTTWMAISATSGNVRWRAEWMRCNTRLDADSFDTAVEANGTVNATSGITTTTLLSTTSIDGLVAGDVFRLRISRVGNDGTNDTMSGDAQLVAAEVRTV